MNRTYVEGDGRCSQCGQPLMEGEDRLCTPCDDRLSGVTPELVRLVERMTGLDVVEVNVNVDDLYLPDSNGQDGDAPARVS